MDLMETEGRSYSDIYRNTSEELFLKSLMETSIGMPVPTMEMLGFKNLSQNFRTDSEDLFKCWLANGENHGHNSAGTEYQNRQPSRRISRELASLSSQQLGGVLQKKGSNDNLFPQITPVTDEQLDDLNQNSIRNVAEKGLQASNLYFAKAWFNSSQPMTRSRSSELRRRYAAMQNFNVSGPGISNLKQEFTNPTGLGSIPMCDVTNKFSSFISPSNSSSSTFNTAPIDNVDKVSSVVSMLKDTLERKKLTSPTERVAAEDSSLGLYGAQEVLGDTSLNQGQGECIREAPRTFQDVISFQANYPGVFLQTVERSLDMDLEGFLSNTNPQQMNMVSREPSPSESSAAAPVVPAMFDACDGPSNSGYTMSESSRKQIGNGSSESGSKARNIRERIYDNLKDDQKKRSLVRYGSMTSSSVSVDKADPTKKRRVERSRKMAEAKERNLTPSVASDVQSILKRCENLEKEVRSLKLNLAFMNRKDSEQTKQIEELQKQNDELTKEKELLLVEIERIVGETENM